MRTEHLLLPAFAITFLLAGCDGGTVPDDPVEVDPPPVVGLAEPVCSPASKDTVNVPLIPQQNLNWCWAAVTQMIANAMGIPTTQCELVNQVMPSTTCCTVEASAAAVGCPMIPDCDMVGWVEFEKMGLTFGSSSNALTWDDIQLQIACDEQPLAEAYGVSGDLAHLTVIKGYFTTADGSGYLIVNDPANQCDGHRREVTYAEYADPAGEEVHLGTWYDFVKL